MKFIKKVIEIKDFEGRGDLIVDQKEPNLFVIYAQLQGGGEDWFEDFGAHPTLGDAMKSIAQIILANEEQDFYD